MMVKYYSLLFFNFFLLISSQTFTQIEKRIKESPILISEGKKDEFIKVMNEVIQSSIEIEYPYGIASGYYGKAYVAYVNRDLSSSINFAKIAEKENIGVEHSKLKSDIYHLLGQNYASLGFSDEALIYYRKMINSSKSIPDKKKSILSENIAYNDIASIHLLNKKNKDSAYLYMLKIYNSLHDYKDKDDKLSVLFAKATTAVGMFNLKDEKKDSAEYYLTKSLKLPVQISNISKSPNIYKHLTAIYAAQGKYDLAKKYANIYTKASEKSKVLSDIKDAYKLNYDISEEIKDSSAYQNLKKYTKLSDSINNIDKNNIKKIFENSAQQNNKEAKKESKLWLYLSLGFIIILIIVSGLYFGIKAKNKKPINILDNVQENILPDNEISNIENTEKHPLQNIDVDQIKYLIDLARNNDESFYLKFLEVFPYFNKKLLSINPSLSMSDLEYCAFIKLDFNTKEIAQAKDISIRTVESKKYRLRKKLNLPEDIKNINSWFSDF